MYKHLAESTLLLKNLLESITHKLAKGQRHVVKQKLNQDFKKYLSRTDVSDQTRDRVSFWC